MPVRIYVRRIPSDSAAFEGELYLSFHCPGCDLFHAARTGGWAWNGDLELPTLEPSLLSTTLGHLRPDHTTRCHLFVRKGVLVFLDDCSHGRAG